MPGAIERLVQDALRAREGDLDARARMIRRGLPLIAKRAGLPAPLVDAATGLWDYYARDEVRAPPQLASYATPGAGRFTRWLVGQTSGFYLIFGAQGTGKTSLACAIADRWQASAKFIAGVPASALRDTPLQPFNLTPGNIGRLPAGAVLIIPDAAVQGLDSRDHAFGIEPVMRKLIVITRHRQVRVIVDSQSSGLMTKSLFVPSAIFIRPLGITWMISERDNFQRLAKVAMTAWAEIPPEERFNYVWAISDGATFMGFCRVSLPEWYSDAISRSQALTDDEDLDIVDGTFAEVGPDR
jgi:hypothetical protein